MRDIRTQIDAITIVLFQYVRMISGVQKLIPFPNLER
jgi:hypothetical protein